MRRPLGRRTALCAAALFVFAAASLLGSAFGYVTDLRATDTHLRRALHQLRDADFRSALGSLLRAEMTAGRAARAAASPLQGAWTRIGPLADEAAGLDSLLAAARDLAAAGIGFIETSGIDHLSDVYRDGTFDLDAIERLATATGSLRGDLVTVRAELEALSDSTSAAVARRAARSLRQIDELHPTLARATTFLEMAPALMGAVDPKSYLLALQSPSEARGGGGLIGVYGVLSFDDGRLELEHVGPVEELLSERRRRDIEAPRWFEQSYGPFGALSGDMRQVNLSPHFPTTARVMLETYERATGQRPDGVIALDPLAIGELLRGTGPLRAPGWHRQITGENVRRTLLHDIYRHFDYREREQNTYLRGLIAVFMERLSSPDLDVAGIATGLGVATTRQHLKVYATNAELQRRISELGVDGDYRRAGRNIQIVFNNNFAANKVDFFLKRTIETDMRLLEDGSASVKVTVSMTNEAPDAKSVLVRPLDPALPFGTNHMLLGLIAPRSAVPGRVSAEGRTVVQIPRRDTDHPLTLETLDIPAGATEEVVYRYDWPRAWAVDEGRFTLTLWPQAAVRPDFFTLRVTPPPSLVFDIPSGWEEDSGTTLEQSGRLRAPFSALLSIAGS